MLEGRRSLREYRPSSNRSPQESFCTLRVTSTPHNLHLPSPTEEELTEDLSNQFSIATILPQVPTLPLPTPIAQTGDLFPAFPLLPPTPLTISMASTKPTELYLNMFKAYDGIPLTAKFWLNSVRTYLLINKDVYSMDDKKVGYALSFMTEGTAKSWAAICTQTALDAGFLWDLPKVLLKYQFSSWSNHLALQHPHPQWWLPSKVHGGIQIKGCWSWTWLHHPCCHHHPLPPSQNPSMAFRSDLWDGSNPEHAKRMIQKDWSVSQPKTFCSHGCKTTLILNPNHFSLPCSHLKCSYSWSECHGCQLQET